MKKLIGVLLILGMMALPAFGRQVETVVIDDVNFASASGTSSERDVFIGDSDKVSFFVTYDQTGTTVAVTANVTAALSVDGINWEDISWFDVAGGVTPQTSEDMTSDNTYFGYFNDAITAPHLRIRATYTGEECHTGMGADITITVVEKK